ncbi:glycosyltransferase [Fusobacterium ulcerans]|uniref:glycosyltransferase n=1 Tax=Fusobacterium ulcerans TaxID=861 RepID=UPI00164E0229|nr:glycosyltransferase [Fusobacterium ulcerans]
MTKILFYNGQLFMGGIEKVLISYLNALSNEKEIEINLLIKENNKEKNIFYKDIPSNIKSNFIKKEKMVNLRNKIYEKKKNIFWKMIYSLILEVERIYMKSWLKNHLKKNYYDVVIDFDMGLGKYLDVFKGIPVIGWQHFSVDPKFSWKKRKILKKYRKLERLKKYTKIITLCDEMKEEMLKVYNIEKSKVDVLYNPFDSKKILEKSLKTIEKEDERYFNEDFFIGVSRLVKTKGREDLIEIYYQLKKRGVTEKLYLLGEGDEKENLQKKIKSLNLEKEVVLLGQKINPYPWIRKAKLFLHTSYGEGLPTVLIESMICRTPIISYDCPTGPKDILEKKYGVLVEMGNKIQFENEVYNLLRDSERQQQYINKFKEKIEEFSIENIISKFKKIVNEVKTS